MTVDDSEVELAEPIELLLNIAASDGQSLVGQGATRMEYTGGTCTDSRSSSFRGEGFCAFDVVIEDDDGTAKVGAELDPGDNLTWIIHDGLKTVNGSA